MFEIYTQKSQKEPFDLATHFRKYRSGAIRLHNFAILLELPDKFKERKSKEEITIDDAVERGIVAKVQEDPAIFLSTTDELFDERLPILNLEETIESEGNTLSPDCYRHEKIFFNKFVIKKGKLVKSEKPNIISQIDLLYRFDQKTSRYAPRDRQSILQKMDSLFDLITEHLTYSPQNRPIEESVRLFMRTILKIKPEPEQIVDYVRKILFDENHSPIYESRPEFSRWIISFFGNMAQFEDFDAVADELITQIENYRKNGELSKLEIKLYHLHKLTSRTDKTFEKFLINLTESAFKCKDEELFRQVIRGIARFPAVHTGLVFKDLGKILSKNNRVRQLRGLPEVVLALNNHL